MTMIEANGVKTETTKGKRRRLAAAETGAPPPNDAELAALRARIEAAPITPARLGLLDDSPFLQRQTWGNVDELATSIASVGVLQPLLGRPSPKAGRIELVFGHRRKRGATKAGNVEEVPLKLLELTDAEVVLLQAIENAQREDLGPLEEGAEYEQLVRVGGIRVEEIGARIGKSRSHVYARIELLKLCPEAVEALREGKIVPSVATYIARIPSPALQVRALKDVGPHSREVATGPGHDLFHYGSSVKWEKQIEPMSARQAFRVIEGKYMLKLASASFDRADSLLVPAAGACGDCPKRTGNAKDLFGDVGADDVCTDPDCFTSKRDAHMKAKHDELTAKGVTVVQGIDRYGVLTPPPGYVRLDEKQYAQGNKKLHDKTLAQVLLGAGLERGDRVVAFTERGKLVELVTDSVKQAAIRKLGGKNADVEKQKSRAKKDASGPKLSREQHDAIEELHEAIDGEVLELASRKPGTDATWRLLGLLAVPFKKPADWAKLSGAKLALAVLNGLCGASGETLSTLADTSLDGDYSKVVKAWGIDLKAREKKALEALTSPPTKGVPVKDAKAMKAAAKAAPKKKGKK